MNWMRGMARLAVALACMMAAPAWAAGGYVSDATGEVYIVVGEAPAQRAKKGDAVVSGALVNTGDKSHAVLRFDDGQVVAMQANTSFHVREYSYMPERIEKSEIVFALLKGGMRFVTGLIGQRNRNAFRLGTPYVTIGIRGTDAMVVLTNDALFAQVNVGGIGMTNAGGTAVFTAGQTAIVSSATTVATAISAATLQPGVSKAFQALKVDMNLSDLGTQQPARNSLPGDGTTATGSGGATGSAGGAAAGSAPSATAATAAGAAAGSGMTAVAVGAGVAAAAAAATGGGTGTTTHH